MAFDETKTCFNCHFRLIIKDDLSQIERCRFNAPLPFMQDPNATDKAKLNVTTFPKIPGPACGQWKSDVEILPVDEPEGLPERIDKK